MEKQKSWRRLLGTDTIDCFVDGNRIIRWLGKDEFKILWAFGTHEEAADCFKIWKLQAASYKTKKADKVVATNLIGHVARL